MSGSKAAPPPAAPAPAKPKKGISAQGAKARAETPLLAKESGNAVTNAVADVVDQFAAPFQKLGDPNKTGVFGIFDRAKAVVGAVASLANAPTDFMNNAFARATDGISKALPSIPAATLGSFVLGMLHTHTHPPSLIPPAPPIPLPAFGSILTGCPTVLICGAPAARSGDYGIAATCGSLSPVFEIFTGSSKVFIGGSRAARVLDMTRQCAPAPPPAAAAAGAMSKMAKAAKAANKVIGGAAKLQKTLNLVGAASKILDKSLAAYKAQDAAAAAKQAAADATAEAEDAAAEAAATAAGDAASAGAELGAALMAAAAMGANLAMDAVKTGMGGMLGKDPGMPMCIGAILPPGKGTVKIGGFPMPSWSDVAKGLKKLVAAIKSGRRGGAARGRMFCLKCM